tara:strand:- start:69 stop:524 length:456 start_codon:yes stop_codon:yes gene_type:complete
MGLDMYLNRKKKYSADREEVGYWRKANQVHAWFVNNVQNGVDECQESTVTRKQLEELLSICKKIKTESKIVSGVITNGYSYKDGKKIENNEIGNVIFNPEIADKLLPTQGGFFFGGTDYDEYYIMDIDNTIEILTAALNYKDDEFIYCASW